MSDDEGVKGDGDPSWAMSRRDWFKTLGVVTLSAGAAAEMRYNKLLPFLHANPDILPGVATYYATSCRECPAGCGMVVRNREARAVKCEGNPNHPIAHGNLCARGQASLHDVYDPDRVKRPMRGADQASPVDWTEADSAIAAKLRAARGRVAVISDLQTGSLSRLIRRWLALFDSDRYLVYEPIRYEALKQARGELFGDPSVPVRSLADADFVVSFGADFLDTYISPVRYINEFADMRDVERGEMGGFVYVGPRVSTTAFNADERILVRPGDERLVALAMLNEMGAPQARGFSPDALADRLGVSAGTIRRLAQRYTSAQRPVALAGDPLSVSREAVETAMAAELLNASRSQAVPAPRHALSDAATGDEIKRFFDDMAGGAFDVVLVIRSNPAYSLPPDIDFQRAVSGVDTVVALTPFMDETAALADWVLPLSSYMESWGDYEPQSNCANLVQPLMGRLYETRTDGDALLALAAQAGFDAEREFGAGDYHSLVRRNWRERVGGGEDAWQSALQRGGQWQEASAGSAPRMRGGANFSPPGPKPSRSLHLYPSPAFYDGRGANKRWLQEFPDPVTKIAWSSWAEVSPADASDAGLRSGDIVSVSAGGGQVEVPAYVYTGLAPGTIAIPIGQGHTKFGRYAKGMGANAHQLRGGDTTGLFPALQLSATGRSETLPCTDGSTSQHGRELVRTVALSGLPNLKRDELNMPLPEGYERGHDVPDLYPPHADYYPEHRWAMVVDLNRCVGCSACMTACYAENNIGVVGREEFIRHHFLSWMRIDRYFDWSSDSAPALFQPMLCQHCDAAPCEPVCPVFASSHSHEGLNMQVYNRCVGTRYCSNNCPYKVRYFNWFDWPWPNPLNWQASPEVTVRRRGVMEKCSFCIQRIREVEALADREERPVRDGEVVPACVQTCPADVFTFGDLMNPDAKVTRLIRENPRAYQVLHELNTKPAVIYLNRVINDGPPSRA